MNNNECLNNELVNGWQRNGQRILHVDEIPVKYANEAGLFGPKEIFIVETVDWATYPESENETILRRKYVFLRFSDAVKFTASFFKHFPGYYPNDGSKVHEDVVSLHPMSLEEYHIFQNVHNYMMGVNTQTQFVSDEEATTIPYYDWVINPV